MEIDERRLYIIKTPIGRLGLRESDAGGKLAALLFENEIKGEDLQLTINENTPTIILEVSAQIDEYFKGTRNMFDIPLQFEVSGAPFQTAVWRKLTEIPFGETRTYGEVAKAVGNPKGARAVGMANNRNPIPIFIPCHRVIGANGKLTGFRGGLEVKKYLLELEAKKQI